MTPADNDTYTLITTLIADFRAETQRSFSDLNAALQDVRLNAVTHAELAAKFEASELDRKRLRADLDAFATLLHEKADCKDTDTMNADIAELRRLVYKAVGIGVALALVAGPVIQWILTGRL